MKVIVGLDIETTGLKQEDGHRIIEVAAILYNADTRAPVGSFVQRINPLRTIQAEAQRVHRISLAELAGEPTWDTVAPLVQKILDRADVVIAHNGKDFDLPFVAKEFIRLGLRIPNVEMLDTMQAGRWACPDGKLPRLEELCFALGVAYDPDLAHTAKYDVERMMECFWLGVDRGVWAVP